MIELDDPFAAYPEFRKEIEKARKAEEFKTQEKKHGGWRPGAGAPKKGTKKITIKFLIDKADEEYVLDAIEQVMRKYGH